MIKSSRIILLLLSVVVLSISCTKDPTDNKGSGGGGSNHADYALNQWIYKVMKANYFWSNDITASPNYNQSHTSFFNSMIKIPPKNILDSAPHDGRWRYVGSESEAYNPYSYMRQSHAVDGRSATGQYSLGLGVALINLDGSHVHGQVIYVIAGSPADIAGIKRGDFIGKIDGSLPTLGNYKSVYTSKIYPSNVARSEVQIQRCKVRLIGNAYQVSPVATVSVGSEPVDDDPTMIAKVFTEYSSKRIGYVMYNSFESDPSGDYNKTKYTSSLKRAFVNTLTGVTDLIIDLRYNGGGYVYLSTLMVSMVVGSDIKEDKVVSYLVDNKGHMDGSKVLSEKEMVGGIYGLNSGVKLGLNKVYIIVSNHTASASELLINGFIGLLGRSNVHLIGETTEGKNVGSLTFDKNTTRNTAYQGGTFGGYDYLIQPIIFYVLNDLKQGDYANGFVPENEFFDFDSFVSDGYNMELGNPQEPMLAIALGLINGTAVPASFGSRSSVRRPISLTSSLDYKRTKGLIIIPESNTPQ